MLRLEHGEPPGHLARLEPLREQLDDFGLRRDRERRHVVGARKAGSPGGRRVAGEQDSAHAASPRSGRARMACGGQTATQIMQPLQ